MRSMNAQYLFQVMENIVDLSVSPFDETMCSSSKSDANSSPPDPLLEEVSDLAEGKLEAMSPDVC